MFIVIFGMLEAIGCSHGHTSNIHDARPYTTREAALAAIMEYCDQQISTQINASLGRRYYSRGHKFADLMERELDSKPFRPIDDGNCDVEGCNIKSVLP